MGIADNKLEAEKEGFFRFLDEWKSLNPVRHSYFGVCELFADNFFFLNVSIKHRESWFKEWQKLRINDDRKLQLAEREAGLKKLGALLKSTKSLTFETGFEEAKKVWEGDSEITRCVPLTHQLCCFEDFLRGLDTEYAERKAEELSRRRQLARVKRMEFRLLLDHMADTGQLTKDSKWKDIYPLLAQDRRYTEFISQAGTLPLVIFWDKINLLRDSAPLPEAGSSESEREEGEL